MFIVIENRNFWPRVRSQSRFELYIYLDSSKYIFSIIFCSRLSVAVLRWLHLKIPFLLISFLFSILVLSIDNDYYVIHNYLHVSMYYARDETPVYLFYFDMWSDASACNHDPLAREQARVCAHFKDLGINVPLFGILFPNFKFIYSFKIWVAVVVIYGGIAK